MENFKENKCFSKTRVEFFNCCRVLVYMDGVLKVAAEKLF